MVAPGAGFRGAPFFGPKTGEDQKKGLYREISGFSVQMRLETKQNEKTSSSPQISGVTVSHHNMVSPGVDCPPPPLAKPLWCCRQFFSQTRE